LEEFTNMVILLYYNESYTKSQVPYIISWMQIFVD
jgi:hypothetical protein